MENTLENKKKFFAQYFGQKVWQCENHDKTFSVDYEVLFHCGEAIAMTQNKFVKEWLKLTQLSMISDEDAIKVAEICSFLTFPEQYICIQNGSYISINDRENDYQDEINCFRIYFDFEIFSINEELKTIEYDIQRCGEVIDYLRSKGYAIPFNGLSVEQQVEYSWIKLK